MNTLAYEDVRVMHPLVAALHAVCEPGEYVIFRSPFRWLRHDGDHANDAVMPNAYEMFSLEQVLSERGLEARYSFEHAAIIANPSPPSPPVLSSMKEMKT